MKRHWKQLICGALALGMMAGLLSGCGSKAEGDSPSNPTSGGGTSDSQGGGETGGPKNLVFCVGNATGDLSPYGGDSGGRHHTYRMLYDCLCASYGLGQPVDELQGQIAKSWTMPDTMTAEIEIYDYVKDSQGNPITASDVVYSYEQAIAAGTNERLKGYLDKIEATGDYTLRLTLTGDNKGAIEWCLTTVPIISEAWFSTASDEDKTNSPATTGAYILSEFVSGSRSVLTKNEDYWQTDESLRSFYDQQTFDTIEMQVLAEVNMRTIGLENKELDVAYGMLASDLSTFMNDDGTAKDGWNVFADENGRFNVLMFNNDNSVFADNAKLRQAVLYAIDFEAVRLGYGNSDFNGSVCHTFGPDVASDFRESWKTEDYYSYDLEKAKSLMAEAGYPDGGFEVTLMYQNSTTATAGLTVLQSYLAEVGITVNLMPADQALFNSYKYDDTKWDIIVDSKEITGYIISVWDNVFNTNAFENGSACFTHDAKLQELLETASSASTSSDEAIEAFHAYLKEQAYACGMFWNYAYYVAQDGVAEMHQDGFGNVTASSITANPGYKSVAD